MEHDNDKTRLRSTVPHRPGSNSNRDLQAGGNELPPGMLLGEFQILRLLGIGGFGIVYLAYDHSLERHVAVKEYLPSSMAFRDGTGNVRVTSPHYTETFSAGMKSFLNEARLLAQFDSAALVKVHRFWEANGTAYMVMPYYEGVTLRQAYQEHRIVPDEKWLSNLLAHLLDAIETIHHAHCLHRDIAPDNILLRADGRPLLLDFGAARRVIGDLTHDLTAIVKPGYAPIEQYGDIPNYKQGPWTDIYALAAVAYYLIAGKAPPAAVARSLNDELPPARIVGKGRYAESFLSAIDHALAVRPEQRIQSIAQLREALALEVDVSSAPRYSEAVPTHTAVPASITPSGQSGARRDFTAAERGYVTPPPRMPEANATSPSRPPASGRATGTKLRRWLYALALAAGIAIAPWLVQCGVDHWEESRPHTELTSAASGDELAKLTMLITSGANVDARGSKSLTALHWAAWHGGVNAVKELIAAGANVHVEARGRVLGGRTALHFAADNGDTEIIGALVTAGADVNHLDRDGYTPLMNAASHGHAHAVKALIAAGSDVNRRNKFGLTALRLAAVVNPPQPDVAAILKEAGAHD